MVGDVANLILFGIGMALGLEMTEQVVGYIEELENGGLSSYYQKYYHHPLMEWVLEELVVVMA